VLGAIKVEFLLTKLGLMIYKMKVLSAAVRYGAVLFG